MTKVPEKTGRRQFRLARLLETRTLEPWEQRADVERRPARAGIERVVTWICGLDHLRETIAFPRMLYRIYP